MPLALRLQLMYSVVLMLDIITCILGAFGFSIILKVSKSKIIYTVLGGTISAVISVLMLKNGKGIFSATFYAMIAITTYSEILARIIKTPACVILMPSTVPLLPGGSLYYTMNCLIAKDYKNFLIYGKETLLTGFGIAFGAVIVSIISIFINKTSKFIKTKKQAKPASK